LNVYGAAKLAGDAAVAAVGGAYLILRTSWVYSARGRNFLRTILRLAESGKPLRIVEDQVGSPTWSRDIAGATMLIIEQLSRVDPSGSRCLSRVASERRGTDHLSAEVYVSWCGFAAAIMDRVNKMHIAGLGGSDTSPVHAITRSEYPTRAHRPSNSRRSKKKLQSNFGISLPAWRESLVRVMDEIAEIYNSNQRFS